MASRRVTRLLPWLLLAAQWLLLTIALAAAITRSSQALRDYISPRLPDGMLLLVAIGLGALLGAGAPSLRVLVALTIAMCLVASALYGAVLYSPAWRGATALRNVVFANYAQQQAFFTFIWTLVPAMMGAIPGHLVAAAARRAAEAERARRVEGRVPWWERVRD
jgi:hypothetical protein